MTGGANTFPWKPGDLWAGRAMVPKIRLDPRNFAPGELAELLVIFDPEKGVGIALNPLSNRVLLRDLPPGGFVWKHDAPEVCTINGLGAAIIAALEGRELEATT